MKKYALPLALVATVTLQACNQQSAPEAVDSAATVTLEDSNERLSYGIAFGLGQRMAADGVPMDVDAFSAGLRDAMEGAEPRMTQEEIQTEMQAYQERAMAEQQAAIAAAGEANLAASEAFLAENATREGVVVTESGLQYEVIEAGEGASPNAEDTVEVHYRGTLVDGTEFDSSYKRGETVSFGVGQVIAGWTEALQLMSPGAKWKLFIPADLAYGPGGAGNLIGPNAALVFEVELVSVTEAGDDAADPAAEGTEG
ncbi:MAG: FKBP-type peptidyl-prolyl cis-trans isomerase [Halieaceae bacterium]|jgi:FKBP-type peptidyl-prolyl cis-trans isomerase|uniref:FKBP-type peptidyl-prolyl cis-trans isomerase n=1 Tax=Haliea alexandrii TaxID=2448162 RepID=UPI000F0B27FE|nr:FKBP-type peptidyl-prolyl cis-trans isomerase [Haliea alexandrii]MCR9185759.1 FKBP-type peptidyl-prolyl cis-trans isomerase [Halieaceae bacterium]